MEQLPAKLSHSEALSQLLQSLDEAVVFPTEGDLGELFRELRPEAFGSLVEWLPRLTNQRVRELLDGATQRLAQAHPLEVVKALANPNEAVLIETVRLVSRLKLPPVVPALGNLLANPSAQLRVTVAETLAAIGTPGALQQLEKAVDDSERDVRIIAIRTLGARGHRSAFPRIEAAVLGKSLREADLSEKMVVFEAYGALAGAAGIERLSPMLQAGGFMKRKEDSATRACAAMALGKIGTPEVRRILEQAAADKDPVVRNAVNKALRELR
jgi:HEAT repeat protein